MPIHGDKSAIPTAVDIHQLPQLARVAFAVRCAHRVQPLLHLGWPSGLERCIVVAETAIQEAEAFTCGMAPAFADIEAVTTSTARANHPVFRSAFFAAIAARLSAVAASSSRDYTPFFSPAHAVAAHSHEAARCSKAAACEFSGTYNVGYAGSLIRQDFHLLQATATREQWRDDTPVPPMVFGPMWPDGDPVGWPKLKELVDTDGEQQNIFDDLEPLTLAIDPGSATPEEIAELLAEISKLYRMVGGSGIDFRLADVWSLEGAVA